LIALIIPILISRFLIDEPLTEAVITSIIFFAVFYFAISSYKDYNNRKNEFKQENTSPVIQETSNFFNKQKSLGYKTPAEKFRNWYE